MSDKRDIESSNFMQIMRRVLAGGWRLSFKPSKGYKKRFKSLSGIDLPDQNEKDVEDYLVRIAADVRGALSPEMSCRLAGIPLALIGRGTQMAALWQHSRNSASFIQVDYGLLRTLYAITTVVVYALQLLTKSKPIKEAADLLYEVFAAHYANRMFERSLIMELDMQEDMRTMALHLTSVQEMFVIAHEYGHHILGHFDSDEIAPARTNFEQELSRTSFEDLKIALMMTNAPRQIQEMDADRFAFTTMIAYDKNPQGMFAGLGTTGLPPMPFLFEGLAAYEFVAYHHLAEGKDARNLFVLREFCGTHPPATMRRDAFFSHFNDQVNEQVRGYYAMYARALGEMVKAICSLR